MALGERRRRPETSRSSAHEVRADTDESSVDQETMWLIWSVRLFGWSPSNLSERWCSRGEALRRQAEPFELPFRDALWPRARCLSLFPFGLLLRVHVLADGQG